jgi:hypothetical protein
MANTKTLKKPAAKASTAPKLNKGKGTKPAKATKGESKPKEPKLNLKAGQEAEFVGYAEKPENPLFEPGDRLTVVEVGKNDDGQQVFSCVKSEDYAAYQEDAESVNGDELFATEIKKAEKLPVDPYAIELRADATLDEFVNENGGDPLKAAEAAIEQAQAAMFHLGGCIALLYAGQKFREYGENGEYDDDVVDGVTKTGSGWDKFCQEHFDMGGRKAHAMVQIYRNYNGLSDVLDLADIAADRKIGWVKLSAAANVITPENAEELVERMRSENVNEFRESIKTDYVDSGTSGGETRSSSQKVRRTTFKVAFFEDASVAVEEVITAAKKQLGTDDLGTVLEFIIMSWAADNLSDTAQKKVRSVRKTKLNDLKKQGVDTSDRVEHMTKLEAEIEAARAEEEEGEEAEAEA